MNDAWGYNDDNDDAGQDNNIDFDGPKALRDAYKKQQQVISAIQAELQAEREERKKEKLTSVFESLGVPGAKDMYQGDADPEKAKAWVESMRGVFGAAPAQGVTPVADSAPVQPVIDQAQAEQYQRMTEAGQNGTPIGGFEAAQAAVSDASDLASLIAAFDNMSRGGA